MDRRALPLVGLIASAFAFAAACDSSDATPKDAVDAATPPTIPEAAAPSVPDPPDANEAGAADAGDGGPASIPGRDAFRTLEPELLLRCGKGCHDTGAAPPAKFLAPPDAYASIKAQPGIVTGDVFASTLLTKGPHAGPALSSIPALEKQVLSWLEAEARAMESPYASTAALSIVAGENDIDLTPLATGGLTSVHLKFKAELIGTSLSLSQIRVAIPAVTNVRITRLRFVRVVPPSGPDAGTDIVDPANSFSNLDQLLPLGQETTLFPGSVIFSSVPWRPFDITKDKLRIEVAVLQPGTSTGTGVAMCKDANAFAATVLPAIRTQQAAGGTCQSCHGSGLSGLTLDSSNSAVVCKQVLDKLNKSDIGNSLIVTKVGPGQSHNGGQVADINAWRALFVNNAAVFF